MPRSAAGRAATLSGTGPTDGGPVPSSDDAERRLLDSDLLVRTGHVICSTLDLAEVARRICREAARAVGSDSAGLFIVDRDGWLRPFAGYRIPSEALEAARHVRLALDDFRRLERELGPTGRFFASEDVPNDPRFAHPFLQRLPVQSLLGAVLRADEEPLGAVVCVWRAARRAPSEADRRLIEGIAEQAAVAIVNARLYAEAEHSAVRRERLRMASELHDALSQQLFSVGLQVDWCLTRVDGDAELTARLRDIRRQARGIMGTIRDLIQELAPGELQGEPLRGRLRKLIDEFQALGGVAVEFLEHGDPNRLSRNLQDVVFRVFQEALTNIIKHARATRARVMLVVLPEAVQFEVTDDGVGPPPDMAVSRLPESSGHLGLRQLAARIVALDGEIEFGANPPSGFCLRGSLPLRPISGT